MHRIIFLFVMFFGFSSITAQTPRFSGPVLQGRVQFDEIDEASGIAASRINPGILWTHNDSGDSARIFAMDIHGRHRGIVFLTGAENRDWEDIAVGPGPEAGISYIYTGDIGDNKARYSKKYIYRFPEPKISNDSSAQYIAISNWQRLTFRLPGEIRDAETLLSDSVTGDLYIVTKRENPVSVYRLPFPQDSENVMTAEFIASIPLTYVVGGDISHDGKEILLKTYSNVFYWQRQDGQPWQEIFSVMPDTLPYEPEPQGEAICWAQNDSGYFTVSEEPANLPANLFFYRRLNSTGLKIRSNPIPDFFLGANYPNPFNQQTRIPLVLPTSCRVKLQIINSVGELVTMLIDEEIPAGSHQVSWSGKDFANNQVTSGFYICRLMVNQHFSSTRKLLFIR